MAEERGHDWLCDSVARTKVESRLDWRCEDKKRVDGAVQLMLIASPANAKLIVAFVT